jgi:hypothetical protein
LLNVIINKLAIDGLRLHRYIYIINNKIGHLPSPSPHHHTHLPHSQMTRNHLIYLLIDHENLLQLLLEAIDISKVLCSHRDMYVQLEYPFDSKLI